MTGADAVGFRPVRLDIRYGAGLPAPGMVNKQLGIDPEQLVKSFLVTDGATRHIAHGKKPVGLQLFRIAFAYTPKIC
ncbi:hypothetical protein SDC9_168280 [bioreactor metagenome]|uniref:Uncharacterized protein n=1 Tax=bioreactor metagenome TaxID=1076179 RepID=A0A645G245_9ZZZZ